MAKAYRLRIQSADERLNGERIVEKFPLRIGRNPLNECPLPHEQVSDVHATLEMVEGELCIRDLRSRNGVYGPTGTRLEPNVSVALVALQNAFVLRPGIRFEVVEVEASKTAAPPDLSFPGLPPLDSEVEPLPHWAPSTLPPLPPVPPLGAPSIPWESPRPEPLPKAAKSPSLPKAREGRGLLPLPPRKFGTQQFALDPEAMALASLKELAQSLVPGSSLETTGDVARFVTKIHDTLEVFCQSFLPLRDGPRDLFKALGVEAPPEASPLPKTSTPSPLSTAKDPAQVAAILLDFRREDNSGPAAVESVVGHLLVHQWAVVQGLLHGIAALLEELSPEHIERQWNEEEGRSVAPWMTRHRSLWARYQAHHRTLATEKTRLDTLLGPEFSEAYHQVLARRTKVSP